MEIIRLTSVMVILLYTNYAESVSKLIKWEIDSVYNGLIPASGGYKPDVTSSNVLQCARLCQDTETPDCTGFVYVTKSSTCQLHNTTWNVTDDVIVENTAAFYQLFGSTLQCPPHWIRFGVSCYLFDFSNIQTFDEAEQDCRTHGGHAVWIESHEENEFIRDYCRDNSAPSCWIGMDDRDTENRWVWHGTGTEVTFTGWNGNEPNHPDWDCAILWRDVDYRWADEPCSVNYATICELP